MKFQYAIFFSLFVLVLILFLLPIFAVADKPTEAIKFVILKLSDSTVGIPVIITIEAQKSNNQVDEFYQNDVTLIVSGSATGAGLVDIVNGIGTIEINDVVAETVALSLSDTEFTGLDVSSTHEVIFAPVEIGAWNQQKFWFRDDDGDEITATGFGAEDVNQNTNIINVVPGANFRLRFAIKISQADGNIYPQLEVKEGTGCAMGNWRAITSDSANFNLWLSDNFADSDSTTQRLVAGQNFIAGQILEFTNPAGSLSMLKNQSTEYEWSLKISQDISLATTHSFRITNNGVVLAAYDQCPSLTIQSPPSGGNVTRQTTVTFLGKAFPGAKIFVVDKDNRYERQQIVSQDIVASDDGSFSVNFIGILQSRHSFGLIIKDKESRIAQTKLFNIDTFANDLVVKDIVVSPTIDFINRLVTRGNNAIIIGHASPESNIFLEIDGIIKKEVKAEKDGSYRAEIATSELAFGNHQVRTKQKIKKENRESDFSLTNTLVVSRLISPKADLSGDEKVDIKDWSMFLFYWNSKDMAQRKIIDFNEDGRVDISDFSIFVKNIRKRF